MSADRLRTSSMSSADQPAQHLLGVLDVVFTFITQDRMTWRRLKANSC